MLERELVPSSHARTLARRCWPLKHAPVLLAFPFYRVLLIASSSLLIPAQRSDRKRKWRGSFGAAGVDV